MFLLSKYLILSWQLLTNLKKKKTLHINKPDLVEVIKNKLDLDSIIIRDLEIGMIIYIGVVDHAS